MWWWNRLGHWQLFHANSQKSYQNTHVLWLTSNATAPRNCLLVSHGFALLHSDCTMGSIYPQIPTPCDLDFSKKNIKANQKSHTIILEICSKLQKPFSGCKEKLAVHPRICQWIATENRLCVHTLHISRKNKISFVWKLHVPNSNGLSCFGNNSIFAMWSLYLKNQTHPNPTCSQAAWVWTTLATKGPAPICERRFFLGGGMFRLGWDKYGGDSHKLCSNSKKSGNEQPGTMSFYLMWRSCESRKTSKWTWKWRENVILSAIWWQ